MKPDRASVNLAVQQEVFERAYLTLLKGLKTVDKKFLESLRCTQSEADTQRSAEVQNLQKSLLAIAMVIKKLKCNMKDKRFVEEHDTEYFKHHLTSIEENISSFKTLLSEQLDALQQEEVALQQCIDSIQHRLNETAANSSSHQENLMSSGIRQRAKSRTTSHLTENIHPDVQEFHQFVSNNGGHTGGWDTNDHLLFTRFLQKYRDIDQMTTALLDFMPDKTPEEIAKHESWYHEYLILKDAQRKALKEWREEQVLQKKKGEAKENEEVTTGSQLCTANKPFHQRDPLVKEKIKQWKEKQERMRQQQLEELQQKKMQEEESWRKTKDYFEQQRQIIAEKRKEEQKTSRDTESKSVECEMNISKRHIPLREFWEQDKQYMQRKQSRLLQLSACSSNYRRRRSTSHSTVHAERDPARLLRPTAVWRARIKRSLSADGSEKKQSNCGSLFIADVPHLAIPKWRVGLV